MLPTRYACTIQVTWEQGCNSRRNSVIDRRDTEQFANNKTRKQAVSFNFVCEWQTLTCEAVRETKTDIEHIT